MSESPPQHATPPQGPLRRLVRLGRHRLVFASCWLSLAATGLMAWSVLDPTPLPVLVAMSVGQVLGTLALGCYLLAIYLDARRARRAARDSAPPAAGPRAS